MERPASACTVRAENRTTSATNATAETPAARQIHRGALRLKLRVFLILTIRIFYKTLPPNLARLSRFNTGILLKKPSIAPMRGKAFNPFELRIAHTPREVPNLGQTIPMHNRQ
jgi:hypothetical protein